MEKRDSIISFTATETLEQKLIGLAAMENVKLSEYMYRLAIAHVSEKEAEARLLVQALGINVKDI